MRKATSHTTSLVSRNPEADDCGNEQEGIDGSGNGKPEQGIIRHSVGVYKKKATKKRNRW